MPEGNWTTNQAMQHLESKLNGLREIMLANDVRYSERFEALKAANASALASADRALAKAEAASEKRFDNTNEWRQTMSDMTRTLMSRTEAISMYESNSEKIDDLMSRVKGIEGQSAGKLAFWGYVIGAVGLGLSIFVFVKGLK